MIEIKRLTESDKHAVAQVQLAPEQIPFAGTAAEFLADESETLHRHIIKIADDVVGFFKIDTAYAEQFDFCPPKVLGLRAFVIGAAYQGKGLGTQAVQALQTYLAQHYTNYNAIYLTVNCRNLGAKKCYLKGGFVDTGEQYLGGAAGAQHIMYQTF